MLLEIDGRNIEIDGLSKDKAMVKVIYSAKFDLIFSEISFL